MDQAPSVQEGFDPPEAYDYASVHYPRNEAGPLRIRIWPKVSRWFLSLRLLAYRVGTKQIKLIACKKHDRFTNVSLIRFAKDERIYKPPALLAFHRIKLLAK